MKYHQRMVEILDKLKDKRFMQSVLLKESAFSRQQNMTFEEMVKFMIKDKKTSLSNELINHYQEKKELNKSISKQAFSEQRQNISYKVFTLLNEYFVKDYYEKEDYKTYKGYVLIANDGSTAEIPNDKNLKTIFGLAKGSKLNTIESPSRAGVNGFYDTLNNIMIISEIDKFDKREKDFLTTNIDSLIELMGKKKILLIFDRGYICTELLILLEEKGVKYVFRTPNTFFKQEIKKLNCNDGIIDLKLTYNRVAKFKILDKEKYIDKTINVRSVAIPLDTGEIEYLITNLNSEEVKYEEMSNLYISRWGIEKSFDVLKNKLQIENIGSKSENGVKQEFYACILLYNFLEDIRNQMNKDIDNNKGNKYEYKINMNILVGALKNNLLKIINNTNNTDNLDEEISLLYKEIRRNLVAIKPDRKNPRKKKRSSNKHKTNLRRSF